MKKRVIVLLMLAALCLTSCGKENSTAEVEDDQTKIATTETEETPATDLIDSEEEESEIAVAVDNAVIEDVFYEIGRENAIDIADAKITDEHQNQVYLLCQTDNGKYKVYGIETEEYGYRGIVIDDIIDGESNDNDFYDEWTIADSLPSISIVDGDEYVCEFHFYQMIDGVVTEQILTLDSYDTGTVSPRESKGGKGGYLIENTVSYSDENTYLPTECVEYENEDRESVVDYTYTVGD